MPKTNRDILQVVFNELAGAERGSAMATDFARHVVPVLWKTKKLDDEISDAEFQRTVAKMKSEISGFRDHLLGRS